MNLKGFTKKSYTESFLMQPWTGWWEQTPWYLRIFCKKPKYRRYIREYFQYTSPNGLVTELILEYRWEYNNGIS